MNNKNSTNKSVWNNYKLDILTLQKANALTDIKFADDYFEIMQNEWLLDKYIAKLGISNTNYPHETKAEIDSAIAGGFAISLAVQSLKDDTIICYKHKSLGELTGLNAYASNLTYEEIKDLTIKDTNEHILTLEEALEYIAGRTEVIVEIYNEAFVGKMESNVEKICDTYSEKYNAIGKLAIMSINPYSLIWFNENAPWYTRILKAGCFKCFKTYANIKVKKLKKLKYLKDTQADFVAYNAKDLPSKYIKRKKIVGVLANNVLSQEEYKAVMPYSDNIIFSNFEPEI